MAEWLSPGLGQEGFKMNLEHLVVTESKKVRNDGVMSPKT